MITFPKSATRLSACVALASLALAGCSHNQTASTSMNDDSGYAVINSKTQSDVYNATASASAHTPIYKRGSVEEAEAVDTVNTDTENEDYAASIPQQPVATTVHFAFDSYQLREEAEDELDTLVDSVEDLKPTHLTVHLSGHTDSIGSDDYNDSLSKKRADAVKSYLQQYDMNVSVSWDMESYGEDRPIATNETESGREQNRRVHVEVQLDELPEQVSSTEF